MLFSLDGVYNESLLYDTNSCVQAALNEHNTSHFQAGFPLVSFHATQRLHMHYDHIILS